MTAKQLRMRQDARCLSVVMSAFFGAGDLEESRVIAMQVGDAAGDEETNQFVTPAQATASLKRLAAMGFVRPVEDVKGPQPWELADMGQTLLYHLWEIGPLEGVIGGDFGGFVDDGT